MRFFEPVIEPLIKSSSKEKITNYKPRLPYTAIYLGGLRLGLSSEDLRRMPYQRLSAMLFAVNDGIGETTQTSQPKKNARQATQADIDRLLA